MGRGPKRAGGASGAAGAGAALRESGETAPGLRGGNNSSAGVATAPAPAKTSGKGGKLSVAEKRQGAANKRAAERVMQSDERVYDKKMWVMKKPRQKVRNQTDKIWRKAGAELNMDPKDARKAFKRATGLKTAAAFAVNPGAGVAVATVSTARSYKKWNRSGAWKKSNTGQALARNLGTDKKGNIKSIKRTLAKETVSSAAFAGAAAFAFGTPIAPVTGMAVGGYAAMKTASVWRDKRKLDKAGQAPKKKPTEKAAKKNKETAAKEVTAKKSRPRSPAKKINKEKVKKGAKYAAIAATGPVGVGAVGYKKYRDWNKSGAWKNSSWGQATAHHYGVTKKGKISSVPGNVIGMGVAGGAGGALVASSFGTPMAPVAGLAVGGTVALEAASIWRTKRQIDKGKIRPNLKYDEKQKKLESEADCLAALSLTTKSKTLSGVSGVWALKKHNDLRKYKKERDRIPKAERHKYAKKSTKNSKKNKTKK